VAENIAEPVQIEDSGRDRVPNIFVSSLSFLSSAPSSSREQSCDRFSSIFHAICELRALPMHPLLGATWRKTSLSRSR
jgi:hypothetical protein